MKQPHHLETRNKRMYNNWHLAIYLSEKRKTNHKKIKLKLKAKTKAEVLNHLLLLALGFTSHRLTDVLASRLPSIRIYNSHVCLATCNHFLEVQSNPLAIRNYCQKNYSTRYMFVSEMHLFVGYLVNHKLPPNEN